MFSTPLRRLPRADHAQDDAHEAKEQLRVYVQDFLLWRDRAKRLEARVAERSHAARPIRQVCTPCLCHSPSESLHPQADDVQRATEAQGDDQPADTSAGDASSARESKPGDLSDLSIPEKYARYFGKKITGGCTPPSTEEPSRSRKEGAPEAELEATAAAWSTRSAIAGALSSPSSRAYFQRSIKAQQEISVRLERDLVRVRADLRALHAGSRARSSGDTSGGKRTAFLTSLPEDDKGCSSSVDPVSREALEDSRAVEGNEDDDSQPREESGRSLKGATQGARDASKQDANDTGACTTGVARVSYTGRVLAALLGGDPTASRTTASGFPGGTSTSSLRLSDYPAALQAVFCDWPAAAPLSLASAAAAAFGPRARGAETLCYDRSGVTRCSSSSQAGSPTEEHEGREQENRIEVDKNETHAEDNAAVLVRNEKTGSSAAADTAGVVLGDRGERGSDRREGGKAEAEGARGSCAVAGAFRGYEAKSPLLQRWLGERFSSPPSSRTTAIK